jgi:TonB family protein
MHDMLFYFIKSGIAMALFYGIYRIFMEKDTNHGLNRFYLAGTMMLSLVLPVLPVEKLLIVDQSIGMPVFVTPAQPAVPATAFELSNGSGVHLSGLAVARIVYLCGITLLVGTLWFQLFKLFTIRKAGKEKYGALKLIYVHKNITPFSILNSVYLNNESRHDPKIKTILDHEYAHFRSLHYIDLILFELITIFQWFNPFTWLFVSSLKEVHEYQADAAVLRKGEGTGSYQALLVNQVTGTDVFRLANGFSKSLTKKRLIMMTKMESKKGAWLKALLALPVLAILLIANAARTPAGLSEAEDYIVSGKVVEAASGEAMPGVSVVWKGTTWGTVTGMNGDFILEVKDENAVVVYSFVGYMTAHTEGAGSYTVKMERKIYEIKQVEEIQEKLVPEVEGFIVNGRVIEASTGEPVPGVNVICRGTTTGTITDGNGDFVLKVKDKDAEVIYAMVGFETASTRGEGNFTVKLNKETGQKTGPHAANGAVIMTTKKGASKDLVTVDDAHGPKEVFYIVEDMPKFQGKNPHQTCIRYVQEHLEYPEEAREKGLEGTVQVFFVVDTKGRVTKARVKKSVHPLLDKAALKAVNDMPDWTPGKQRGKPVAVQFEIPVEFKR